jgi:hypothetical protein
LNGERDQIFHHQNTQTEEGLRKLRDDHACRLRDGLAFRNAIKTHFCKLQRMVIFYRYFRDASLTTKAH